MNPLGKKTDGKKTKNQRLPNEDLRSPEASSRLGFRATVRAVTPGRWVVGEGEEAVSPGFF